MARRNIRGLIRVKRLLKRMPDDVRAEIVVDLHLTGRRIAAAMDARTPHKTGFLREGLSYNLLPKTLRLQVGLLARRRASGNPRFYGRILDLGRRAQVVTVHRYRKGGRAADLATPRGPGAPRRSLKDSRFTLKPYKMRVRAIAAKRFVTGRYPDLRQELSTNLRGTFARALRRQAGGSHE